MTGVPAGDSTNLLIIAPPGCGKTEMLAQSARQLIPTLRPNQRILALTFSNKARDNLGARIQTVLGPATFRRYVRMRNFHGHATEVLRAHAPSIGLPRDFTQPTPRQFNQAVDARLGGLPVRQRISRRAAMWEALGDAKRGPRTDDEVMAALIHGGNADALAVQQIWSEQGVLHYDDLLRHAQRLLRIDAIANLYQHHYGAVLVDEYQDLSPQQLDIGLRTVTQQRLFAGDPLQGIYTWAGARPAEVGTALRQLCGDPIELTTSYRSSPNVLAIVNAASAAIGGPALHSADPGRWPGGGCGGATEFATGAEEAAWISQQCQKILERDPQASIGVITRSQGRREPIDNAIAASGLTHSRWDSALDDPNVVEVLRAAWRSLPANADFAALQQTALQRLETADSATFADVTDALAELEERIGSRDLATTMVQTFTRKVTTGATGSGVHLLNAHVGKGQQFDWVFVPGIAAFHLPSSQAETQAELEEEDRVVLVILSRARHGLILSRAASLISAAGNPWRPDPSKYWSTLSAAASLDRTGVEAHIGTYQRP